MNKWSKVAENVLSTLSRFFQIPQSNQALIVSSASNFGLVRAGIDVSVFEQASELREVGAGIMTSPTPPAFSIGSV